ncbi:MAG: ABC transporter ATP-binding protein [Planctomycetota bacterium]|nr:ABC transporter ATP-binding protein [Blastopirellula sp.]
MIETRDLTKRFGDFTALDRCTLQVARGEVFGLLGPNGAGKSTLIRLLLGFMQPTSGAALVGGLDCYRDRLRVHQQLSYLPGDARLFRAMNGRQVLRFFSQVRSDCNLERALQIAQRLDLNLRRWVGFMSTGMRQKLALTATLAVEQPLLILDEPTANLDPTVRGEILKMVLEARSAGRTVLFSSHVLSEIEEVCDRVAILRSGQLVYEQCMSALKQRYRITLRQPLGTDARSSPPAELLEPQGGDASQGHYLTTAGLPEVLSALHRSGAEVVHVQPEGLRAIYERYHGPGGGDV